MTATVRYWSDKNLLVTVDGPEGSVRTLVEKPFARLGSHASSEIVLKDKGIALRSLYFHATDVGVFCVPLSHSHSLKNSSRGWLGSDQVITVGPYRISARLADGTGTTDAEPDLEAKGTAATPSPVVVAFVRGREIGKRPLTRRLTLVGRHQPCTIRLTSHSVSASHCVMYWDAGTLWIVDLFSTNGTWLNGHPIETAELPPGGLLALGTVELTYLSSPDGPPTKPAKNGPQRILLEPAGPSNQFRETIAPAASQGPSLPAPDLASSEEEQYEVQSELAELLEQLARQRAELAAERQQLDAELLDYERRRTASVEEQQRTQVRLNEQVALIERQRQELENERKAFKQQRDQWLLAQKEREDDWQRRTEEIEQKQAALLTEQQDALRRKQQWDKEKVQGEAQLSRQTEQLKQRVAELESQYNEFRAEASSWKSLRQSRE